MKPIIRVLVTVGLVFGILRLEPARATASTETFTVFLPLAVNQGSPVCVSLAGVGVGADKGSEAELQELGARWFYDWTGNACSDRSGYSVEYVPMTRHEGDAALGDVLEWLVECPDSYVLIGNEPNDPHQDNFNCLAAAEKYGQYAWEIKRRHPQAKVIVGGILTADFFPNADVALQYADCMVSHMPRSVRDSIDGWHFHFYAQMALNPEAVGYAAGRWRAWLDDKGFHELWLTETGILGNIYLSESEEAKLAYAREVMGQLCGDDRLDRWAWFSLSQYDDYDAPSADLYDRDGELTKFGEIYIAMAGNTTQ